MAAVDKVAVRIAAGDYLAPEGLHFVVVGDATSVLPALMVLTAPDGAFPGALRTVDTDGHPVNMPP